MNENLNEQTEAISQVAEANKEGGEDTSVSLGKFKDVNALLAAYNSLQAEFTKRCQRIKELETIKSAAVDKDSPTEKADESASRTLSITDEEKENFIKGYLKEIIGAKSKAIVMDGLGTGITTPVSKPRTVEEAGKLAKELLAK
ncbi:MAG: hypothetical protein J5911_04825 [Clostridia bacterium]|nr:hypothetical protein [Clostridia bacterium]